MKEISQHWIGLRTNDNDLFPVNCWFVGAGHHLIQTNFDLIAVNVKSLRKSCVNRWMIYVVNTVGSYFINKGIVAKID